MIRDHMLEPPPLTPAQELANALLEEYELGRRELEKRRMLFEEQQDLVDSLCRELEERGYTV